MALRFAGPGQYLPLNQWGANEVVLNPGQSVFIPEGTWAVQSDGVAGPQYFDPITQIWTPVGVPTASGNNNTPALQIDSDGGNFRIINNSGLPVEAILTASGSGYTSAPTVTPSEGNSTWRAIVGGAISTTVTITSGGSGYTYWPTLLVQAPPPGGVPAVARVASMSGGAITAVAVQRQGAGYLSPPPITVLKDPRDTTGQGASLVTSLVGAGQVTSILCVDSGYTLIASGTVPTLTFAGGGGSGAAATAMMEWIVTGFSVTSGGAGYVGTNAIVFVEGRGAAVPNEPFFNGAVQTTRFRPGQYEMSIAGGALTGTANPIQYATVNGLNGAYLYVIADSPAGPTTRAILGLTVGGLASAVYMQTTQA